MVRTFYVVWTRVSAAAIVLWAASFPGGLVTRSDFAETGLLSILIFLLAGGAVLFILGVRDLIRDFHHVLQARSDKESHASV